MIIVYLRCICTLAVCMVVCQAALRVENMLSVKTSFHANTCKGQDVLDALLLST